VSQLDAEIALHQFGNEAPHRTGPRAGIAEPSRIGFHVSDEIGDGLGGDDGIGDHDQRDRADLTMGAKSLAGSNAVAL
jgi:hypothetical protein